MVTHHPVMLALLVIPLTLGCVLESPLPDEADFRNGNDDDEGDECDECDLDDEIDLMIDDLELIVDLTTAYYHAEHPFEPDPYEYPGVFDPNVALHRCPHPLGWAEGGQSEFTPDLLFDCNQGPECKCIPGVLPGPSAYTEDLWLHNSVWMDLGFEKDVPHAFHYNFEAVNDTTGFGACEFTVTARGDLDGDGIYSTYSIRGELDQNGDTIHKMKVRKRHE